MRKLLLTFVLALTLCVPSLAAETWNVGTWKTAQTIQPFLYEPFANGATVKVHPFTNPGDQKAALLAGSLDMTGTTLALAIQAASRGEPIVLVASLGNKCSALVVKKGGVKSVGDLEGKKIGYVPGTMHEILLRETLTRAGLNPDKDAKLVRIDFFDMGTALSRGDIDAYLSGEPLPTLAKRQGYGEILAYPYYGEGIGAINSGMIVRRDFVEKNPERVIEMLRAHRKATEQCMSDKAFWLETSSKMFGVELDVLRDAADNMELVWDMDDTFMKQLSALGKRMLELGIITSLPRVFGVQSEHADPVYRYYAAPKDARVWQPVTVTPSVAQAAMIGNPVSFPRVQRLAEKFIEKGGEKAFQVVQVTEQQIMDAMIVANRHGHIACTQGGECLAGLVNARALGLVGDDEHAVLDATAHALKFSGFQDMYFNDSFPEAYGVKPQAGLSNKPELLLPESAREGKDVATFARMGADAVVARLGLSRK